MHIIGFVLGTCVVAAGVAAVAVATGLSGWVSFGLGAATFVISQCLYLAWVTAMVRLEARRRRRAAPGAQDMSTKSTHQVVQKG